jgi:hypothetical protein
MPHGPTSKLSHAAQLDIMKLVTIALSAPLLSSGTLSAENVNPVPKAISTTHNSTDVTVKSHAPPQEKSTQPTNNVNVQLIKRDTQWCGMLMTRPATAHLNSHSGTVNTVSSAHLKLNSMTRKNNATTVLKDSLEIALLTAVSRDCEFDPFIELICLIVFYKRFFKNERMINFRIYALGVRGQLKMQKFGFSSSWLSFEWEKVNKKIAT